MIESCSGVKSSVKRTRNVLDFAGTGLRAQFDAVVVARPLIQVAVAAVELAVVVDDINISRLSLEDPVFAILFFRLTTSGENGSLKKLSARPSPLLRDSANLDKLSRRSLSLILNLLGNFRCPLNTSIKAVEGTVGEAGVETDLELLLIGLELAIDTGSAISNQHRIFVSKMNQQMSNNQSQL